MYPSMLSRGPEIETEPYYCLPVSGSVPWSQPTSPTPRGLVGLLSPTHTNHRLVYQKKNDEGKLRTPGGWHKPANKIFFSLESSRQPNFVDVGRVVNVRRFDDRRAAAGERGSEIETWIDWSTWTSNELIESIVNKRKYLKIVCHPISLSTSDALSIPPERVCVVFLSSCSTLTWTNKRFMRNRIDTEKKLLLLWKSSEMQSSDTRSGNKVFGLDLTCVVWTA